MEKRGEAAGGVLQKDGGHVLTLMPPAADTYDPPVADSKEIVIIQKPGLNAVHLNRIVQRRSASERLRK